MQSYRDGQLADVSLPSTTFEWKRVKMRRSSAPQGCSIERSEIRPSLKARDPHQTLDIRIRYVGGPEASSEIRYRGRTWRFGGYAQLIDVIQWINGQSMGETRPT